MELSKKHQVLVVDDDEIDIRRVRRWIGHACELFEANSGRGALAFLAEHSVDCVLLDHRLPDVLGQQILQDIVAYNVAVVMMTGQGSEQVAVAALKRGCYDYLVKNDLTPERLLRTVGNAVERHWLEFELDRQRKELEEFVAKAAHDLRGPLRTIASLCQIMEDQLQSGNLETLNELLQLVTDSAKNQSDLVDSLLHYTRLGNSELRREAVDLNETVKAACAGLQATIKSANARCETTDLPTINGDRQLLLQMFQNLIENAIKFRDERAPLIKIDAAKENSGWRISVVDNGIGIDAAHHEAVFRPLQRLHSDSKIEGFGIGLSNCQRIVEKHSGRIWIDSETARGTTIHIILPD